MIDPITILSDTGLITVLVYPDGTKFVLYNLEQMN